MTRSNKATLTIENAPEPIAIEILFNSIEVELARRWAFGEVPPVFTTRPVDHLRKMVKAWWQMYHESTAAASGRDRTTWERNQAYPAEALDTLALVDALRKVREIINLDALRAFRQIYQGEDSAIGVLELITAFYVQLTKQTTT